MTRTLGADIPFLLNSELNGCRHMHLHVHIDLHTHISDTHGDRGNRIDACVRACVRA